MKWSEVVLGASNDRWRKDRFTSNCPRSERQRIDKGTAGEPSDRPRNGPKATRRRLACCFVEIQCRLFVQYATVCRGQKKYYINRDTTFQDIDERETVVDRGPWTLRGPNDSRWLGACGCGCHPQSACDIISARDEEVDCFARQLLLLYCFVRVGTLVSNSFDCIIICPQLRSPP